jgi:O-antigen/teichoic acid export membrane protein
MRGILSNVAAIWSLFLLFSVLATLLWFFYRAFLRKILRMRRIAALRSKREMLEAATRDLPRDSSRQ